MCGGHYSFSEHIRRQQEKKRGREGRDKPIDMIDSWGQSSGGEEKVTSSTGTVTLPDGTEVDI